MLDCERARSERSGCLFSLIVFDIGNSGTDTSKARYLVDVLTKRIRFIDGVGWLGNQRIGVILPYTPSNSAWNLADDVCQAVAVKSSLPECTVYTYPLKWFSDDDGYPGQLSFQDVSPEWKTTISHGFSTFAQCAKESGINFSEGCPSSNNSQDYGALAEIIKPSFLCPLPFWKRLMDVSGALVGLIILSPIMLIITAIIKLVSPGPAFFKQQRTGYMGKMFDMWKFRTMKPDADPSVHQQHLAKLINSKAYNKKDSMRSMTKLEHDARIIPFGKILRKTYLDELPQLVNVLRGEMSLVGPRPPIPYEVETYLHWHKGRLDVVPGMTGLWQVSGKNRLTFNEMARLDIQYRRKETLWLDIKILLMTPIVIFSEVMGSLNGEKLRNKVNVKDS